MFYPSPRIQDKEGHADHRQFQPKAQLQLRRKLQLQFRLRLWLRRHLANAGVGSQAFLLPRCGMSMILRPSNKLELSAALQRAHEERTPIASADLTALQRIVQHTPEDMTVTVEAGLALGALQTALAQRGQWLPIDPPNAGQLSIADLLASNASGPRRLGHGTIRDHLIGIEVVLADGRLVHSGGKVVKNVAGFDVMKLFVGGQHSLGFVVEATFKLLPLPEAEQSVQVRCPTLAEAGRLIDAVMDSELCPVAMELHHGAIQTGAETHQLLLTFAGPNEDVAWQLARAAELGVREPASLADHQAFWADSSRPPTAVSVLPSTLVSLIQSLGEVAYVARAGNGMVYHRGDTPAPRADVPRQLLQRVKQTFDPHAILPAAPLV